MEEQETIEAEGTMKKVRPMEEPTGDRHERLRRNLMKDAIVRDRNNPILYPRTGGSILQ